MSVGSGNRPQPVEPRGNQGGKAQAPSAKATASSNLARLVSLDAYRGFVMILMASEGLRLAETSKRILAAAAKQNSDDSPWKNVLRVVGRQFEHVEWRGAAFWDLIQPSFTFMVGVAMAYSCASRMAKGASYKKMLLHALWRSFVLVALGVFLRSRDADHVYWTFEDTLSQIGLGYFFLFLLWGHKVWIQWAIVGVILVGYWALFFFYPVPDPATFNYRTVGLFDVGAPPGQPSTRVGKGPLFWKAPPPDEFQYVPGPNLARERWPHLQGIAAHWDKNTHAAQAFDRWFLNVIPRPHDEIRMGRETLDLAVHGRGSRGEFMYNRGGYMTLSFIPTLATMIFGLFAGELLRGPRSGRTKFLVLLGAGILFVAIGELLDRGGVCPVVKRIWTPSWTIWSAGVTALMLAAFYGVIDLLKFKRWAFPFVVVGMNSILAYCIAQLCYGWIEDRVDMMFGWRGPFFDPKTPSPYKPLILSACALAITWSVCYWLYRKKAFVKI